MDAVADTKDQHPQILLFTLFLGGLITQLQRGGGAHAVATQVAKCVTSRRSGLGACLGLTLGLFFDDFTCILVTGSTLCNILASQGISPLKAAQLIHPVAVALPSFAPISVIAALASSP